MQTMAAISELRITDYGFVSLEGPACEVISQRL